MGGNCLKNDEVMGGGLIEQAFGSVTLHQICDGKTHGATRTGGREYTSQTGETLKRKCRKKATSTDPTTPFCTEKKRKKSGTQKMTLRMGTKYGGRKQTNAQKDT